MNFMCLMFTYVFVCVCVCFHNSVPDGCAGLPNVPNPLLNACGANKPPPIAEQQNLLVLFVIIIIIYIILLVFYMMVCIMELYEK